MATQFDTQLQQLYVAYFNRPADPDGLAFYADKLATGATDIAAISASFAQSGEYKAAYNQSTYTGVVDAVYQNLFGHAADSAGRALYADALANGSMTVAQMVTWISGGALGADKIAYDSKVQVAVAFTNSLDATEAAAYNSAAAQTAAKELLSTIKTAEQATAAVVPATLDASVAAVIKAGTPFSLESGLAALGAAQAAKAEFLKEEDTTVAAINKAVSDANTVLVKQIDADNFATASVAVKAALIADQIEYNDEALEDASTVYEAAQAKVVAVTGLADAIAASTSAAEAVKGATTASNEATGTFNIAANTFEIRNVGAEVNGSAVAKNLVITNAAGVTIASSNATTGAVTIATGVKAADYAGLQAVVDAAIADSAAAADAQAARDAALIAEFRVAVLENPTAEFTGFEYELTTPGETVTVDEVADELAADAAAGDVNYGLLRTAIQNFINNPANTTPLADAVFAAEQGGLAQAKAAVADVVGLAQALALRDATTAATQAETALDLDLDVVGGKVVLASDNTKVIAEANATSNGKLVIGSTVTEQYDGLTAYVSAFNKQVDALTAYNATTAVDGATAATQLIADNTGAGEAVTVLNTQQGYVDAAPADTTGSVAYANYIKALGVNGAQDRVEDLADAVADLEEAQAVATELKSFDDAIAAATADFADHDFNAPVTLTAAVSGRTGTDIFIVDTDGTVNTSLVSNFGRSGDDVLFVGSGYTFNAGDVTKTTTGDAGVLEVFFTQSGNNTIVTIEKESYGSNTGTEMIKVTLTGVDAADLSFENGIISL